MKNKIKLLLGVALTLVVTSCGDPTSSTDNSSSSGSSSTSQTTYKTNEDFEYAKTTYEDGDGNTKNLYRQTLYKNQNSPHLDSLEKQRVLVVPFGFTDEDLVNNVQTQENINRIKTVFFGSKEETDAVGGYYSVKEYYKTSSFGKANFDGDVVNTWCTYNGTSASFKDKSNKGVDAATYVRSWYLTEYAKNDHGQLGSEAKPLSYYDQDNDGYIDLLWIVYSVPYSTKPEDNQAWWAYVTYTTNGPSEKADAPNVMTLGWASINFMKDGFGGYDSHTFIHETGHTFGLDDYYDYSDSWTPMGAIDMMDNNIGDHCAFSKFSLGWLSPLVVDDNAIITLRPTTTTGDCFIIPSKNYNGTAFDEYMMVEFMAPTGLAEIDYKNGYKSISGYSQPGIRISHVDARVVSSSSASSENYLTNNPQDGVDIRIANSKGGRTGGFEDANFFPVEVNGKTEYNSYALTMMFESNPDEKSNITTSKGNSASNASLFGKFASFDLKGEDNIWANIYMPSKSNLWNKAKTMTGGTMKKQTYDIDETCTFDYKIEVLSVNNAEAKVRVTKI